MINLNFDGETQWIDSMIQVRVSGILITLDYDDAIKLRHRIDKALCEYDKMTDDYQNTLDKVK